MPAKKKTPVAKRQTTLRLGPKMLAQFDKEATALDLSRTSLLEQVIAQFLQRKGYEVDVRVTI